MNKLAHGRIKRVAAEFRGDEAIEIELLEVRLRLGDIARTRLEADTQLIRLAFKALTRSIDDYCAKTGSRYPPYRALRSFLAGEPALESEAEDPRIVSITK